MALSYIISEIKRGNGQKSRFFHAPPVFDDPGRGSPSEYCTTFGVDELECWVYQVVKKFDYMFSRFDTILACDGRTDGHTDILQQHSPRHAYASCGKKKTGQQLVSNEHLQPKPTICS